MSVSTRVMDRLQDWFMANKPPDEWKIVSLTNQIFLVRDKIMGILAETYDQHKNLCLVAGDHLSKSIRCPVYHIDHPAGFKIWMRDNFYNWNVSVQSVKPLECDFLDVFDEHGYSYCYCEGMEQWKFDSYTKNKSKFTVCIHDSYDLYTFFRVLRKFFSIKFKEN